MRVSLTKIHGSSNSWPYLSVFIAILWLLSLCHDAGILNPFGVLERVNQVILCQPTRLRHCYLVPLKLLNPGA